MLLNHLKSKNRNLWLTSCINFGNILLQNNDVKELEHLIKDCKDTFTLADGSYDRTQNGLLDIFALEIHLLTSLGDHKRLRIIFPEIKELASAMFQGESNQKQVEGGNQLQNAIIDPKVSAVINECGGKLHMGEKQYKVALSELF